ncbi:MAG: DUF1990 domain-containing protein [Planctomycetota bacterium]
MFRLRRPSLETIRAYLRAQSALPFSYPSVGGTAEGAKPKGFDIDRSSEVVGHGRDAYERVLRAVKHYEMFRLPWIEFEGHDDPVELEQTVATCVRFLGVWSVNPCRVVYVEPETATRFAFAFGTLPGHSECGEERFCVELSETGEVRFTIDVFSKPQKIPVWLVYPLVRRVQDKFRREATERMRRIADGRESVPEPRPRRKKSDSQ